MCSDDLLKMKGALSTEGANFELGVGSTMPAALRHLFPTWAIRVEVRQQVASTILGKLQSGASLAPSDVDYAMAVFGEAESKWIRRREIAERAARALETEKSQFLLMLPQRASDFRATKESTATAEDWVNKFWADAELVSDETLQEIYARILASEALRPGTCSLSTLRILRYLDREIAESFAKLVPLALDNAWVPRDSRNKSDLGLSYGLLLELDDAGLVDANPMIAKTIPAGDFVFRCGARALLVTSPRNLELSAYPLTRAGRELARVAQVDRTANYLIKVGRWLAQSNPGVTVSWAEIVSTDPRGEMMIADSNPILSNDGDDMATKPG